jgi:glycine cleavage system H protein
MQPSRCTASGPPATQAVISHCGVADVVSETPSELKYSASHEWVRVEGDEVVIGITDHAQAALNDIVFVEMPEVGGQFDTEQEFGVVESVKSVSDLYMPVAGEVTAVNDDLEDAPEIINEEPYGGGWLLRLKPRSMDEVAALLDAGGYLASLE